MSEADGQAVTVTADGVAVEKSYEFERFPVPAVTLVVRSLRDDPATVRLTDPLPDVIDESDVGLHSEYGEEYATVADGQVRLEFDLDPDQTVTIVYGIRDVEPADLAAGPAEPGLAAASRSPDSSEVVREVLADDEEDESVEPIDLADPTDETAAAEAAPPDDDAAATESSADGEPGDADDGHAETTADADGGAPEPTAPRTAVSSTEDSLIAAMADEVRSGTATQGDIDQLREALDVEAGDSSTARISALQTEVADLRAYTDALEAFLDENGTAREILTGVQGDVDAVRDDVESLRVDVDEAASSVETLEETVVAMEDDLDATRKRVTDLEERVEAGPADLADRLDEMAADLESLSEELDEVIDVQQRLQSVFADGTDPE